MAEEVEIRKAPKLLPFGVTGFVVGALVAIGIYFLIPNPEDAQENALGLFIVYIGGFGAAMGVVVAIVIDLITARRTKKVLAERETISKPESQSSATDDKVSE